MSESLALDHSASPQVKTLKNPDFCQGEKFLQNISIPYFDHLIHHSITFTTSTETVYFNNLISTRIEVGVNPHKTALWRCTVQCVLTHIQIHICLEASDSLPVSSVFFCHLHEEMLLFLFFFLFLTFSFLTQLEAPAARLWFVWCSPVAHLTREGGRQEERRGEERRGEERRGEERRGGCGICLCRERFEWQRLSAQKKPDWVKSVSRAHESVCYSVFFSTVNFSGLDTKLLCIQGHITVSNNVSLLPAVLLHAEILPVWGLCRTHAHNENCKNPLICGCMV